MAADLHVLKPAQKSGPLPDDLPALLRKMADDVEAGRLTGFYAGYTNEVGEYGFVIPSSINDTLILAALMYDMALSKYRR